jgi:hypothetical protein
VTEKLVPAKKNYSVQVGAAALHSRYDPALEAKKYIDSLYLQFHRYFVLIEPGLGYLAAALKKLYPLSKIITIHCSSFFNKDEGLSWNPGSSLSLEYFLEEILVDSDASEIQLIEWKPSVNAYGKSCLDIAKRTIECIRRISAGRNTVRNFGRRWIRNVIRNLELFVNPLELIPGSGPVIVCAAGPSLEASYEKILKWKQSPFPPFLIAVSSAAPALMYRGIRPDCIVATDGGPWALFHLFESYR